MGTAGVPEMAFGLLITMAGPSEGIAIWGQGDKQKIQKSNIQSGPSMMS